MGLLEQEINELRMMNEQVINGTIKPSEVSARIAIYSQTEKRARLMLQSHLLGAKFGARGFNKLANTQMIGDGSVIDLTTDAEKENIICPDLDKTITRDKCYRYSSETGNMEGCQTCYNYGKTRKLINKLRDK